MARTSKKTKTNTETMMDHVEAAGETASVEMAVAATPETAVASGETVFIPLNKLKKSLRNARKTPHTEADIGRRVSRCGNPLVQPFALPREEPER